MQKSVFQRIEELESEKTGLIEAAKDEALKTAEEAIEKLKKLGFDYKLVNGTSKPLKAKIGARQVKDAACPICEFRTDPPHDGRTHRSQKKKKAFTAQELEEKGLTKV
jgi:hypothetical protein